MSDTRQHHKDGFSQWPSIAQCNGFANANRESKQANEGTMIHAMAELSYTHCEDVQNETALWVADWLLNNENGIPWKVEKRVEITDCGRLTGIFGAPDYWQINNDMIRVADLKSFSDGSKDYFAQLAGYALAIATDHKITLDSTCELTVLHGLTKRAETRYYTVLECLDIAKDIYSRRYDNGNQHTICDACAFCSRQQDGTCKAQAQIIEATKVEMSPVTFPVSQEQLIASPGTAAKVAIIAQAGVKFWERQLAMCKESAKVNNGIIDDGQGCKFILKTVEGRRVCNDLLALAFELNENGIANEAIIKHMNMTLTALRELISGLDKDTAKAIEQAHFRSESEVTKFERCR